MNCLDDEKDDTAQAVRVLVKRLPGNVPWLQLQDWSDPIPFLDYLHDPQRYSKLGQDGRQFYQCHPKVSDKLDADAVAMLDASINNWSIYIPGSTPLRIVDVSKLLYSTL